MKKYIFLLPIILLVLNACNDSFLEKYPKTSLTEGNAFETYDNFKAFAFPLYEMFTNTTIATSLGTYSGNYSGDVRAGYLTTRFNYNPYAFQTIGIASTGNGWDFGYIRRANILLSNIDKAGSLSPAEKNHWRAVGYFFLEDGGKCGVQL